MKKSFICFFTAVLFLMTVSCAKKPIQSESDDSELLSETDAAEETTAYAVQTTAVFETAVPESSESITEKADIVVSETCMLKPGVWYAYNEEACSYYFISPDGMNARKVDVLDAMSTVFRYENISAEKHEYKYYTSTGSSTFVLNITSEETAELIEKDKPVSRLKYCSDTTFEHFQFFSDEELENMALSYYSTYSSRNNSNLLIYTVDNEDETVDIYLYVVLNGKENILEIFSLDRFTASGTSRNGEIIDLCMM